MMEHVRALGIVSLVRSVLELLAGLYLLLVVSIWSGPVYPDAILSPGASRQEEPVFVEAITNWFGNRFARLHPSGEPEPGDQMALGIIGGLLVLFGGLRSVQSFCTLLVKDWARKIGLFLAVFDFVTPVTLPLAFWSIVVYRHPETRDYFTRRGRPAAATTAVDSPALVPVD